MHARRALLDKLATLTDWNRARGILLHGEAWIETRNTIYCFRNGVCVAVSSRGADRRVGASTLVGMRIMGWLRGEGGPSSSLSFGTEWSARACAVLWRPGQAGADAAMGMTSPSTALKIGRSLHHLQALHDQLPPDDSQTYSRAGASGASPPVPSRPTYPSYRSG